jgi:predicted NBD/HSP70 family sugar kinase
MTSLFQHLKEAGIHQTELPHLVELFENRNKALMVWLGTAASYLSGIVGDLQLLFDPEAFVIGGHLPRPLSEFLCEHCWNFGIWRSNWA